MTRKISQLVNKCVRTDCSHLLINSVTCRLTSKFLLGNMQTYYKFLLGNMQTCTSFYSVTCRLTSKFLLGNMQTYCKFLLGNMQTY